MRYNERPPPPDILLINFATNTFEIALGYSHRIGIERKGEEKRIMTTPLVEKVNTLTENIVAVLRRRKRKRKGEKSGKASRFQLNSNVHRFRY